MKRKCLFTKVLVMKCHFQASQAKVKKFHFPWLWLKKNTCYKCCSVLNLHKTSTNFLGGNHFPKYMLFFAMYFCWHFHFWDVMNPFLVNYLQLCWFALPPNYVTWLCPICINSHWAACRQRSLDMHELWCVPQAEMTDEAGHNAQIKFLPFFQSVTL